MWRGQAELQVRRGYACKLSKVNCSHSVEGKGKADLDHLFDLRRRAVLCPNLDLDCTLLSLEPLNDILVGLAAVTLHSGTLDGYLMAMTPGRVD